MHNGNKPNPDELPTSEQLLRSTLIAAASAAVLLVTVVLPAEYGIDPTRVGRLLGLAEMGEIKAQLSEEAEADRLREAQEPAAEIVPASDKRSGLARGLDWASGLLIGKAYAHGDAHTHDAPAAEPAPSTGHGHDHSAGSGSSEGANAHGHGHSADTSETADNAGDAWTDTITVTLTPGQGSEVKLVMEKGAIAQFDWTVDGGVVNYDLHGDNNDNSVSYQKARGVPGHKGYLTAEFAGQHGWFWRNRGKKDVTITLLVKGSYSDVKRYE